MTRSAESVFAFPPAARVASAICRSAKPPISATLRFDLPGDRCRMPWRMVDPGGVDMRSPKRPVDVVLGALVVRRSEHLARRIELDQLAEIHKGREVGNARRLADIL